MAKIGSAQDLPSEFGGTCVPDNSSNDGSVFASYAGCEEACEDDERVFERDSFRRCVALEDVPDDENAPSPWTKGSWAKRGHFPMGIAANRA